MPTQITKAEFDALPDSLKGKFTASGDAYLLQEEDLEGLKKSKAEILEEKKRLQVERDELAKYKAERESEAVKADEDKQREAGEFKKLEEKLRTKIAEIEQERDGKDEFYRKHIFEANLKNLLSEKGVRPEMAKYALLDASGEFELGDDLSLRLKSGIGDAKEVDGFISKLREATPAFFSPTTQTGGGASGSGNNGGNAKTITAEQYNANFAQYSEAVGKGEIQVVG